MVGRPPVVGYSDVSSSPFELCAPLLRAVEEREYQTATAVQTAVIPAVLQQRDLLVRASTGSGKTAAFVLPILEILAGRARATPRPIQALLLVPTRELAIQIDAMVTAYGKYLPHVPKMVTVRGGVSVNPQMMALRGGADIVVATPGRLLDLIGKNALSLGAVSMLVLDEADRMLDLGFADEVQQILGLLPSERQTLLFSATLSPRVRGLAEILLRDPVEVDVSDVASDQPAIVQRAIEVDTERRTPLLRKLLDDNPGWQRVLVFVATTYSAEHIAQKLRNAGLSAEPLHGKLSTGARARALQGLREGEIQVVVATDLAGRGLDIPGVSAVVNYDLPRSANDYVHRIGRTGRAGASGVAVNFVTAASHAHFRLIEKRNRLQTERERVVGFEPTESPPEKGGGGVKGKRKSKKDKLREAMQAESSEG